MAERHTFTRLLLACSLLLALPAVTSAFPNIRLTSDASSSTRPRVALDPQANVIVVWQDGRFGNDEILWQKFDQLGSPLTTVVRVTITAGASRYPDVSCDANGVSHITWQEGENVLSVGTVYFCRLDATGTKVLSDVQVAASFYGHPQIAALADGSTDLTFFRSSGVFDFYTLYRRYSPAGAQVCAKQLGSSFTATVLSPTIASSSAGVANVFWLEIPTSNYEVRSGSVASCGTPSIQSISGATSTTVTTTAIAGPNLFRMFDAGGNILNVLGANNVCQISQGSGQASSPSVGADASDAYVVWRDNRDAANGEIYLARFWSCTNRSGDIRLTIDPATSVEPDIAVDPAGNGNWVAVWRDDRDGNSEIYLTSRVLVDPPAPAAPSDLAASLVGCPPTVTLHWTDHANNEDHFEIEMQLDGSGEWVPQTPSPGSDATSWSSGGLAYGHSYDFRVSACNGSYCSAWAGPASQLLAGETRYLEGTVRATVIDRGIGNNPSLQPLPRVRVALVRGGQRLFSSLPADANGYYAIGVVTGIQCDDSLGVYLENEDLKTADRNGAAGDPCTFAGTLAKLLPLPTEANADLVWPVEVDGISGDAVNAHYWIEHAFKDYWQDRFGLPSTERMSLSELVRYPEVNSFHYSCGASQGYFLRFGNKFARFRSAVVHEFTHHIVRKKAGHLLRDDPSGGPFPQAEAMEEALADYFTAAYSGNTEIHPRTFIGGDPIPAVGPIALRNIDDGVKMRACGGDFATSGDAYRDATPLAGALWDWRTSLAADHTIAPIQTDQEVFEAIAVVSGKPAANRTFLEFRALLAGSVLGKAYPSTLEAAFDGHNIKHPANDDCPNRPVAQQHESWTQPDGRHIPISWTRDREASGYRIYVHRFGGLAVGLGDVVADSLTDTTFVHVEADTTVTVAFIVVTLDSTGAEMAASDETPRVTGIDPVQPNPGSLSTVLSVRAVPNPSRGSIRLELSRPTERSSWIRIYDLSGRLSRVLRIEAAGVRALTWDGLDRHGRPLPVGIYLLHIETGGQVATARFSVVR